MIETVVGALGGLDVLVCAAAVLVRRTNVEDVSEADWDYQHDINLKSTFFLNQAAAPLLGRQGRGGRIVNFTSQGWWSGGFGGSVAYAASKGGIVSMTRGLARSLAKDNITVNAVSPGAADTAMMRSGMTDEQLAEDARDDPARTYGGALGTGGRSPVSRLRPRCLRHRRDNQCQRRLADVLTGRGGGMRLAATKEIADVVRYLASDEPGGESKRSAGSERSSVIACRRRRGTSLAGFSPSRPSRR